MPTRRTKAAAHVQQDKEQQSHEMRRSRLALFIQQFDKDAQERMSCLEAKLENLLVTVDKVFKVELMKMPPSLQNTLMGDLMLEEEASASEVSIAIKNESREMDKPFRRITSKRLKSSDTPPVAQRLSSKTSKGGKRTKGDRVLVGSSSTGTLVSSTTIKRTQSRLTNRNLEQTTQRVPRLRSVVSAGALPCSMAGSAAHITVTTAQGQMFSFSEHSKDDINLDLLDDVAWCQIQKLSKLMEYLSRQSLYH